MQCWGRGALIRDAKYLYNKSEAKLRGGLYSKGAYLRVSTVCLFSRNCCISLNFLPPSLPYRCLILKQSSESGQQHLVLNRDTSAVLRMSRAEIEHSLIFESDHQVVFCLFVVYTHAYSCNSQSPTFIYISVQLTRSGQPNIWYICAPIQV